MKRASHANLAANTFVPMQETVVNHSRFFPKNSKVIIFGAGYTGKHLASILKKLGVKVICSRRIKKDNPSDFIFDSTTNKLPNEDIFLNTTHILSCIPPDKNGEDPVINKLGYILKNLKLKWAGYLSTTGVYGDSNGEWVNEEYMPMPNQNRSKRRLDCESEWINSKLPVQILRLPGIYGPGRSALDNLMANKCRLIDKPGQIFSRIHIDDIAGAVIHLINLHGKGIQPKVINIADNLPCRNIDVIYYAAKLLKIDPPPIEPFHIASNTLSPMALSFWQENRRVSNKMLCKELHYSLIHPDYKSGLIDCLKYITN